jgi:hypothetical protein
VLSHSAALLNLLRAAVAENQGKRPPAHSAPAFVRTGQPDAVRVKLVVATIDAARHVPKLLTANCAAVCRRRSRRHSDAADSCKGAAGIVANVHERASQLGDSSRQRDIPHSRKGTRSSNQKRKRVALETELCTEAANGCSPNATAAS